MAAARLALEVFRGEFDGGVAYGDGQGLAELDDLMDRVLAGLRLGKQGAGALTSSRIVNWLFTAGGVIVALRGGWVHRGYSLLAVSGPVTRLSSGKVATMRLRASTIPAAVRTK